MGKKIDILLLTFLFCYASSFGQTDTVSVIGTGDIMLGSNYPSTEKLPPHDGKQLLREVKEVLRDADVTFGNLEGCFLDNGGDMKRCSSNCYYFRMPDRYVNHLLDAGYDVMSIANNHMGDFGEPGRKNTVSVLQKAGLNYAGLKDVCEVSRFERNGVKFGFCAFAPNAGTVRITDISYAQQLVKGLDADCDVVIVSFHGGAEGAKYNHVPKTTETFYGENRGNVHAFAHAVIDAGADIVFGHGPHVTRAAELYKDRFIIYSMGNFCTAGDFNILSICGYAPIVKVFTDKTGKFLHGKIISARQLDKTGPTLDNEHLAAKEIKRLTSLDFPSTNLLISNEGDISIIHKEAIVEEVTSAPIELEGSDTSGTESENAQNNIIQDVIHLSSTFLGTPYRAGTSGPKTFDCSGFVSFLFNQFGLNLPRTCKSQMEQGVQIAKTELKPGDLVFFKGSNIKSSSIGHVGLVIENDDSQGVKFIHACRRGVIEEFLKDSQYYQGRYVTGVRLY